MTWSEHMIARALALQTFGRQHLVVVDNCNWTGHECDLLVVTKDLRVIDVEIKISRADLRADAKKDKWWHRHGWRREGQPEPTPRAWPPKVWKHYYALPADVWKPEMLELCKPESGVLLLREGRGSVPIVVECKRRSTPCRTAEKISAASAVDIARLASLRMWESYAKLDKMKAAA